MDAPLKDRLSSFNTIALYGAGEYGKLLLSLLQEFDLGGRVIGFLDSNPLKQGQVYFGLPVFEPGILKDRPDAAVIISAETGRGNDPIYRSLSELVHPDNIFAHILLMENFWRTFPAILDRGNVQKTLKSSLPDGAARADRLFGLLPYVRTRTPRRHFYEQYDAGDDYTKTVLDWYTDLFCLDSEMPGILSIQPYSLCAEYIENHPFNRMYWSECPDFLRSGQFTVCDVGAFSGDSIADISLVFRQDRIAGIYAFEPDDKAFERLRFVASHSCLSTRIDCIHAACGDVTSDSEYKMSRGTKARGVNVSKNGRESVRSVRLDDVNLNVQGTLCIKMDVDGFEMKALQGAAETIRKYRPLMAVCVYHKTDDVWRIPEFLRSLVPAYRFVLRGGPHMVCYANPTNSSPISDSEK